MVEKPEPVRLPESGWTPLVATTAALAVGVNCTYPSGVPAAVTTAAASGKPVVVYPNSGEGWDAQNRTWTGEWEFAAAQVSGWVDDGARLVGGCCRVRPEDIGQMTAAVRG